MNETPLAENTIKGNIERGLLRKDYNKKNPYLLDGLSTLYAADEKNDKKAAKEARKIAYMEGLADYEDLLYKPKEEKAKFTTLEYKPTGEIIVPVKYANGFLGRNNEVLLSEYSSKADNKNFFKEFKEDFVKMIKDIFS